MSKSEIYFRVATGLLILSVILHTWLGNLPSYDSDTWVSIKDVVCYIVLLIVPVGVVLSTKVAAHSQRRVRIYVSIAYIVSFMWLALVSFAVIAVSGIGFLG